jgi:hypothetical protein
MRAYVRKQISEGLGLDLPVHLVSTVGAGAALAYEWFDREIAPLCARAKELADASARRKLAGLREGVGASLRALLKSTPGAASSDRDRPRAPVEQLALEAEGRLQETGKACERLFDHARSQAPEVLAAAARDVVQRLPGPGNQGNADRQRVRETVLRAGEETRAAIRSELMATRDQLRTILAEMGKGLGGQPTQPEDLTVDLVTQPVLVLPPELDRIDIPRPAWLKPFPSLLEKRIAAQLLARVNGPLYLSFSSFVNQSREWLHRSLGALAARFASQSEPLRAHARRLAESGGAADQEAISAELRQIEESPEPAEVAR